MKEERKIIYTSEPDYEGAEEYIEGEVGDIKQILEKLAEENWVGSVLAKTCENKIEELKNEEAYNSLQFTWECEKDNLNEETVGEIVIIAGLGLWDGRHSAVKETGKHNLNTILDYHGDVDDIEVFVEDGEVRGLGHHHDGTNEYTFREVIDEEKWEKLAEKIMNGEKYTKAELNKATKSLAERVNKIYGWK